MWYACGMELTKLSSLVGAVRDLTEQERELYDKSGPATWPEIKQISARHHRIAQLLATGLKQTEVARAVGCTDGTVSRLVASPAFKALIQKYIDDAFDNEKTLMERMRVVSEDGLDLIHERIVTKDIDTKDLINATSDLFDRTGFGKTSTIKHEERRYLAIHEIREIKETYKKEASGRLGMGEIRNERSVPSGKDEITIDVTAERVEVREASPEGFEQGFEAPGESKLD